MNTTRIERQIVATLVEECTAAGFAPVKVWDGGEYVPAPDVKAVLDAVFSVGVSTIHFSADRNCGVMIVLGNGEDCISDYHCGDAKFSAAVEKAMDRR